MFYNLLDLVMLPAVHIHKSGFIYFARGILKHRPIGSVLAALQSLSQGLCMSLLSFNFVYRYSIIHSHGWGRYWYVWPIISSFLLLIWTCAVIFFVMPTTFFDFYFRESVYNKYGVDTLSVGYYAVVYEKQNETTGRLEYYYPSIFCLGLVAFCQLVTGYLIGVCGYYLYESIKKASNFASGVIAKVHKDLFWTLVLQTITPCLLVYIPGFTLIITPLLDQKNRKFNIEDIQPLLISIFPIVDTVIILVCFRGFRKALTALFSKTPPTVSNSVRLQHIT